MIKTINLQKIFKTEEVETWALNNVSIEVKQGEFVAIMGPSGCGKSTLLNILGLLDNPTGGEYYLNGTEVSRYTESQRTSLRKGVIGFVFQSFNLIDELNVYENIELPLLYMGISAAERKKRVESAMERMAITHRSKHFPQQLSGGQQQRVAIARAVVANPKLILTDEPTGNLDSKNGKEVVGLLSELNKEGTTIVMVTHSQHDAGYADRIINLFDGLVETEVSMYAQAINKKYIMIKHYLKVAFRNLIKYKTQSLVSIIGLAVGFTCFALSVLWIRYEMTYDNFHEGADRIYLAGSSFRLYGDGFTYNSSSFLADYLAKNCPEIEYVVYFMTGMKKRLRMRMLSLWYDV